MKGTNKAPNIVVIGAITLITVVFWIVFGIVRILTTKGGGDVPPEILAPLNPTLDATIISQLEGKIFLSESEIGETVIVPEQSTPSEQVIPQEFIEELSTQSGTVAQPQSTEEGELVQ
jgi:hypothetical protein